MNADVSVREVMDREYVGVSESDALVETCAVMLEEDTSAVVVLRGSEPVGVVTERDVLSYLVDGGDVESATVEDAMTDSIPTVEPDRSLASVAGEMTAQDARRLLVTNGDEPLGVITEHDVVETASIGPDLQERPDADTGVDMRTEVAESETARGGGGQPAFEDQAICEACGSLSRDLSVFNGQLLCSDCRDV